MSKARLLQDYLIPGSAENENTLITDYWLEFVAATDQRDAVPVMRFSEEDIREKLRSFQQQMSAVIRNHESLRQALSDDHLEPMTSTHPGPGASGMPVSWVSPAAPQKGLAPEPLEDESDEEEEDFDSPEDGGSVAPNVIGSLLMKLLGK
jgi:hypothetical protein